MAQNIRPWLSLLFVRLAFLGCLVLPASLALAQTGAPATPAVSPSQPQDPDVVSHETTTFKVRVNQVLMRVVVRDGQGNTVGDLTRDKFEIFDNGKPQTINAFSLLRSGPNAEASSTGNPSKPAEPPSASPERPERYIAYLFDDVHLEITDLQRVQEAARKHLLTSMRRGDRAGVFTTSGRQSLDFTDDVGKLLQTMFSIRPVLLTRTDPNQCPWMSYYVADLIINKADAQALQTIEQDAIKCLNLQGANVMTTAEAIARSAASREIDMGDTQTRSSLMVLRDILGRLSTVPGQRSVVLVSPGFLAMQDHYQEIATVLDKALRSNVAIDTLDARGLFTDPEYSAQNNRSDQNILQYMHESARQDSDILAELADGSGGTFFQNNNDLVEGFRRTSATPEYVYLLAFTPQNLKLDGKFHTVKVLVKAPAKLSVRTRKGYFAPNHAEGEAAEAKSEIEDAVFSREERQDIPVDLHTEFFKTSDDAATVALLTHVDLRHLTFRKESGRNMDTVTVVSALFDRNGKYLEGQQKTIEFHMRDEVLARHLKTGIAVKSSFEVKPGDYLVRVVVRDTEGQLLSAKNDTVQIP